MTYFLRYVHQVSNDKILKNVTCFVLCCVHLGCLFLLPFHMCISLLFDFMNIAHFLGFYVKSILNL